MATRRIAWKAAAREVGQRQGGGSEWVRCGAVAGPSTTRSLSTTTSPTSDPLYPPTHPTDRPIPSSSLSALLARLSLPSSPTLHTGLLTCLTHPSYKPSKLPPRLANEFGSDEAPDHHQVEDNELLSALGNSLLGLFTSEHLSSQYPNLPTRVLKAAVSAYVGPSACLSVGRELGVGVTGTPGGGGVPVRWVRDEEGGVRLPETEPQRRKRERREAKTGVKEVEEGEEGLGNKLSWEQVVAGTVRSFVALVYQEKGIHAARAFVHSHFLSRHVDLASLLSFRNPKTVLSVEVRKLLASAGGTLEGGIESRLLAESGRASLNPIFSIGLFLPSGLKLSEGFGSSLRMAEHRAAVNALTSIYLVRGEVLALARSGKDAAAVEGGRAWELPTEVHREFPLGRSHLKKEGEEGCSGTGSEMESGFRGNVEEGRTEVLVGSRGRR